MRDRCRAMWAAVIFAGLPALCRAEPLTPYTAFAWIDPVEKVRHVVGAIRYQASSNADEIANALNGRPVGTRVLLRWESNDNHIWHHPADQLAAGKGTTQPAAKFQGPWIPNGAKAEATFEGRFAGALRARGATVDYLILDTEMGVGTWGSLEQLAAIVTDPRWPALAKRFGVHSTAGLSGTFDSADARAFNRAMQVTAGGSFHDAFYGPWLRHFPDLHCSDFGDGVLDDAQAAQAPDDNGIVQPMSPPMHGDTQSPYCYGWVHKIGKPPANRGADFGKPLPVLCWLTGMVRGYARSPLPVVPWVAAKSWTDGSEKNPAGTVGIRNTAFQDELVWHACLSGGSTNVLYFNPDGLPADDGAMDEDLATLQRQTADAPSLKTLTTDPVPFDAAVLVSGAVTPTGRRVYRVTVGTVEAKARQVDITLPGEHATTKVQIPANACGAWVVR